MASNDQTKTRLKFSQANVNPIASCWASGNEDRNHSGSKGLESFHSSKSATYSTHSLYLRLALLCACSVPKQTFYSSGLSNILRCLLQFKHHLIIFIR